MNASPLVTKLHSCYKASWAGIEVTGKSKAEALRALAIGIFHARADLLNGHLPADLVKALKGVALDYADCAPWTHVAKVQRILAM